MRKLGLFLVICALAIPIGWIFAQRKPLTPDNDALEKVNRLTGRQKVKDAEKMIDRIKSSIKEGFSLREKARKKNDLERLNCINASLAGIRAMLRKSEQLYISLTESVSRKDKDDANSDYLKITLASNKVDELGGVMRSCGLPTLETGVDGRPKVELTKDSDLPVDDPVVHYRNIRELLARPRIGSLTE
ncbi:MAG: hypothetical protein KC609_01745 [Myxococcales bacterium]|nr:hypothetical protein [Myxococcales bacterium]